MAIKAFTAKDGELRIYDATQIGTTSRPYFIKILFVNSDLSAPMGRNRPEEVLVLDRMKFDCNTHFVQGSDAAIADPLPLSFSFRTFDRVSCTEFMNWILKGTTTQTAAVPSLTSTKGTSRIADYAGVTWQTQPFTDTQKKCFNIEVQYPGSSSGATAGKGLTLKLKEVFFNPGEQTLNEGEDAVNISLSGLIYGSIDFGSLAFTTGSRIVNSCP